MKNFLDYSQLWGYVLLFSCFIFCGKSESNSPSNISKTVEDTTKTHLPVVTPTKAANHTSSTTPSDDEEENSDGVTLLPQNFLPLPDKYNKLRIPANYYDGTEDVYGKVEIHVSMFIRSILDIDEKNEVITLDTDFRVHWVDWAIYKHLEKLNFEDPVTGEVITTRTLAPEALKQIWVPDLFVDEMASVEKTSILGKLVTLLFLGYREEGENGDNDSGDIIYTSRVTLKLRCGMTFYYYPADTQNCDFHIRSYSYNQSYLSLHWANGKSKQEAVYLNDPNDPNFSVLIEGVRPTPEQKDVGLYIFEQFDRFRSGKYSALKFSIKIRRELTYHLVQTYLPSMLLIFITWLCFLLPINMVEARIGISMTTLLTLTAMFSSVRQESPDVSYTMAIDIWMVFCIFCVFIALLLFTVIYWMKRHLEKSLDTKSLLPDENIATAGVDIKQTIRKYEGTVAFSKVYAFWAFAIAFLTFLCSYWGWLIYGSGYADWTPDPKYNALDKKTNYYQCYEGNYSTSDSIDMDYFTSTDC